MSHLQYHSYEGVGKRNLELFAYQQAVRVENQIFISGQGKQISTPLLPNHDVQVLTNCKRRMGS